MEERTPNTKHQTPKKLQKPNLKPEHWCGLMRDAWCFSGFWCLVIGVWTVSPFNLISAESWQSALEKMPLQPPVVQLNRTNCVALMLHAFQANQIVRGLVFMPGATDEFYMFRRAKADLTNAAPSLLDAVIALTNQTFIRATFRPPLLLLHTDEDPLEPAIQVEHEPTAEKLKKTKFVPHALYNDRDWDFIQPVLRQTLKLDFRPWRYTQDSWHFYRHSFAGWNLTGWEALEAVAAAGKSRFTVRKGSVIFECDTRVRALPKVQRWQMEDGQ